MKYYNNVPNELQPLSPWTYFWLSILFSIPVIGLIFNIIFAVSGANINRRNYARSYFCWLAIGLIFVIIIAASGGTAAVLNALLGNG